MKRKILAALLLAFIAILLALSITHLTFREMMGTVDDLATPNEKVIQLNNLFEEITTLDQQQRAEAIENPEKPYKYFLDQSSYLQSMIDSLQMLPWDSTQLKRLSSLKSMLDNRNELFVSYLKVKAELANNREFSQQLDTLSILLKESQANTDSSIITTQRKTITTYLNDSANLVKSDKGFLKKLFSKKKNKPTDTKAPLKVEELNVTVDTLMIAKQGVDVEEIRKIMKELETDQRSQRKKLQQKELELINANSLFINRLINTLHEVENEELRTIRASSQHASQVVSRGLNRMNVLMLSFFLGAAVLVYFIFIDISRSNYYKKQLEKALGHAEELSKIKQRFLANMSHEIRTPLQSIIGFAEQLRQSGNQSDKESVEAIYSSSEHLLQIVNEVLDYSRISSGKFTLANEKFHLHKLIKEVESSMRVQAERKKLTFILDTENSTDYRLVGDPFRLRQILYNLLGNAIKFTHKGFIRLSVKAIEEDTSVQTVFEITDSGIGMDAEELKKVFNQFEQANADVAKNFGGTGLGLTIVKSLVEVQQGDLEVSSEPGIGTTFRVVLKFNKLSESAAAPVKNKIIASSSVATHILVVDDDAMILKLCGLILKKNNIQHSLFNNPHELLNKKPDRSISHIFIDIRMPQMNGLQLCKALKAKYPEHTRFIALTAHVLPDERDNLLQECFDLVLTKPFHEAELLKVLNIAPAGSKPQISLPDFTLIKQMTMGDEALFQSVMQQFVDESDEDYRALKESINTDNKKQVREIVHKLAGRFAQMGIFELSGKLHEIEVELVDGKSVQELIEPLQAVMKESITLLQNIRLTTIAHLN